MITSTANRQVKQIIQLNKKARERNKEDVFVAEGVKMFLEAPSDAVLQVYVSESFIAAQDNKALLGNTKYEVMQDHVFSCVSDTKTPQGILCIVRQFHYTIEDILARQPIPHILVLEDLQDPGNFGTIMRTGEGAGISGIIASRNTVDIYNPKTIRSTMGSIYRVPFVYAEDLTETVSRLKEESITVYAAHLKGSRQYDENSYMAGTAFLIGNEGNGLSEILAESADVYLKIPMEGRVESLNAAVAAAVLMYEANRQRRNGLK